MLAEGWVSQGTRAQKGVSLADEPERLGDHPFPAPGRPTWQGAAVGIFPPRKPTVSIDRVPGNGGPLSRWALINNRVLGDEDPAARCRAVNGEETG